MSENVFIPLVQKKLDLPFGVCYLQRFLYYMIYVFMCVMHAKTLTVEAIYMIFVQAFPPLFVII